MGGHKSVQQMTMNIGPMFVFLRMYLIAVCLDVRRSAASPRRPAPRAFRPGVLALSPRAAAPSRFFSSGRYCTICACDCGREETRLKSTISVRQRRLGARRERLKLLS